MRDREVLPLVGAAVFAILGIALHPLWFTGAFVLLGVVVLRSRRQRRMGLALFALAMVYFSIVLGYMVGRDAALRDNASGSAPTTAPERRG